MKIKKSALCALAAVVALMTSCVEKIDWDSMDATIEVTPSEISFDIDGGEQTIHLYTTREWKATDVPEWVIITPSEGSPAKDGIDITVKVAKNDGYNRIGAIEFNGGIVSGTLTVGQSGPDGEDDGKISVADFINKADTATEYTLTGKVSNVSSSDSYKAFTLTDTTGSVLVFFPSNFDEYASVLKTGATATVTGKYEYYSSKDQHELVDGTIKEVVEAPVVDPSSVEQISCADFISKADETTVYRLVGTVTSSVNTSYCSFDMNDGTATVVVWTVNNKDEWKDIVKQGGTVTVRGIYTKFTSGTTVKHEMIDAYIEKFEAKSVEPETDSTSIYSAALTDTQGDFTVEDKVGTGIWTWSEKGYGMLGTGYINSANTASESWLLSPVIDLAGQSAAYLEFDHALNFFTDVETAKKECTVWIKAEGGEWAQLAPVYPDALSWSFINSGSIDISSYAGKKIQVGFKYTSTETKAGSWEVKNFKITKTKAVAVDGITWTIGSEKQTWTAENGGYAATVDGIKVGYYQNSSTTTPIAAKTDHIRVYKSSSLKITSDKTLQQVVFYCTASDYCNDMKITKGDGTLTQNKSALTLTWKGSAKEIEFTLDGGQNRFSKIVFVTE